MSLCNKCGYMKGVPLGCYCEEEKSGEVEGFVMPENFPWDKVAWFSFSNGSDWWDYKQFARLLDGKSITGEIRVFRVWATARTANYFNFSLIPIGSNTKGNPIWTRIPRLEIEKWVPEKWRKL